MLAKLVCPKMGQKGPPLCYSKRGASRILSNLRQKGTSLKGGREIELVAPKLIVCLGALAGQTLIRQDLRITRDRGSWAKYNGIDITATFHPAALLRNPGLKRPVWEDFKAVRDFYRRLP